MRSIQQMAGKMGSGEQAAQQLLEGHRWNTLVAAKAHSESSAGGQQQSHPACLPACWHADMSCRQAATIATGHSWWSHRMQPPVVKTRLFAKQPVPMWHHILAVVPLLALWLSALPS